jgi:hypothetical protein
MFMVSCLKMALYLGQLVQLLSHNIGLCGSHCISPDLLIRR